MFYKKYLIFTLILSFIFAIYYFSTFFVASNNDIENIENKLSLENNLDDLIDNSVNDNSNSYIKWVDFKGSADLMNTLAQLDISSHNNNEKIKFNWIELMALLSCKYGGELSKFKQSDLDNIINQLESGKTVDELSSNYKLYNYFYESLDAIFHEYIGDFTIQVDDENGNKTYQKKYGIKVFSPIAKGYSFNHYKDFGASRSYGYKRLHLGNDILGNLGTPIIAVESGYVEALGWNQYGGWRVGIRSFDQKRYYYYAHLRKDHPFAKDLQEGQIISAGDVIGYMGMTGYSSTENVNNINIVHLHFGVQLIFNEAQKDGTNQIWINTYEIIEFLRKNASRVNLYYPDTNDFERVYDYMIIE